MSWTGRLYHVSLVVALLVPNTYPHPVHYSSSSHPLPPLVFIPGHGGNQLDWQVSLDKDDPSGCGNWNTHADTWERSWLNLWQFLPAHIDCWSRLMPLDYNLATGQYSNHRGVKTRTPGWGDTHTMEFIDPSYTAWLLGNVGQYAAPLINELREWGYVSTENLRGAPYDFRYGASHQPDNYSARLKSLIESTYVANGNHAVMLMSHSMGGLVAHDFLTAQTQEWKDQYIAGLISMNTPWKGTVTMIEAVLSGYTWGHSVPNHMMIRRVQRNSQSGFYLFPSIDLWGEEEVVVQTPTRNYTTRNYHDLLWDIDFVQGAHMYEEVRHSLHEQEHPGVPVYCLYSDGVPTAKTLVYNEHQHFPDSIPEELYGPGDGTVNLRSLEACREWRDTPLGVKHTVKTHQFHEVSHHGVLKDFNVHQYILDILMGSVNDVGDKL